MANEKRLIDAYKLENLVRSNSARYHHVDDIVAAIVGQPTVDAVEVVHGRWEQLGEADYKCSECGFRFTSGDPISKFLFCRCGTKMDKTKVGNENA